MQTLGSFPVGAFVSQSFRVLSLWGPNKFTVLTQHRETGGELLLRKGELL